MLLFYILFASFLVSLGSLVGVLGLSLKNKVLQKILLLLVSLSAGSMMGGAFFHLLPEAIEANPPLAVFEISIFAYVLFFILESVLHWHHCHTVDHSDVDGHDHGVSKHTLGYMNLFGDSIHNFIDGLILAAAFSVSVELGVVTTIAVAFHEIPQELSDFGVLVYSGFSKSKALVLNFTVALTTILGGFAGYYLADRTDHIITYLVPFAAGGFIYIATTDLVPQINHHSNFMKAMSNLLVFVTGLAIMYGLLFLKVE